MGNDEMTPQERAAKVAYNIAISRKPITTSEVANMVGISYHGARRLMHNISGAGIPVYQDDRGRWRLFDNTT